MVGHSIKDKTVLVTGGAKNLGGLITRDLAVHGAKAIVIHCNSTASKADADAIVAALQAVGVKAVALQDNPTSAAAMEKLFTDAIAAMGRPDIAINIVGKVLKKPSTEISEAEYDEMSAVNAKSAFFFPREVGEHVNDDGKIYTLVTFLLGAYTPYYAAYVGTKVSVKHFICATSKEFDVCGISVTAVSPDPTGTPLFYLVEGADAVTYRKAVAVLLPFSRTGLTDIEDVMPFTRHLVSEGWWIIGQTILVNGGYTTK